MRKYILAIAATLLTVGTCAPASASGYGDVPQIIQDDYSAIVYIQMARFCGNISDGIAQLTVDGTAYDMMNKLRATGLSITQSNLIQRDFEGEALTYAYELNAKKSFDCNRIKSEQTAQIMHKYLEIAQPDGTSLTHDPR